MIMRFLFSFLIGMFLVSCSTKEEQVLAELESLTQDVKENGAHYTSEDWQVIAETYEALNEEVLNCQMSSEEQRRWGKLQTQFMIYSAGHFKNEVDREIENASNTLKNVLIGVGEGLRDLENVK